MQVVEPGQIETRKVKMQQICHQTVVCMQQRLQLLDLRQLPNKGAVAGHLARYPPLPSSPPQPLDLLRALDHLRPPQHLLWSPIVLLPTPLMAQVCNCPAQSLSTPLDRLEISAVASAIFTFSSSQSCAQTRRTRLRLTVESTVLLRSRSLVTRLRRRPTPRQTLQPQRTIFSKINLKLKYLL